MPNWCTNTITIKGEEQTIKEFQKKLSGISPDQDGIFVTLIGKDKDEHNDTRYGTKWDIFLNESNTELNFFDGCLEINCATAWSPPTAFIKNLSMMYKVTCEMTYEESGEAFAGEMVVVDGEITQDDRWDIEDDESEDDGW